MAKKGRRKFRRYIRGVFNHDFALGAFAGETLIGSLLPDAVTETTFCTSVRATWSLGDFPAGDNDGPILVGWAHGDYSDAEVESWLEATSTWEVGNLIAQELMRRKIKIVGTFPVQSAQNTTAVNVMNDGRPVKTKLNWMLQTGQILRAWAFNEGTGTITSGTIHCHGVAHLWPR